MVTTYAVALTIKDLIMGKTPAPKDATSRQVPLNLYCRLRDGLKGKERLALATVISRSGSGPREPGAGMLIAMDGETLGTVGGGLLEAKVQELAKEVLKAGQSACLTMTLTSPDAAMSGMICGGRMEILVEYFDSENAACLAILDKLLSFTAEKGPCLLIRSIRMIGDSTRKNGEKESISRIETGWGLMAGGVFDRTSADLQGIEPDQLRESHLIEALLIERDAVRYFLQPVGALKEVLVVGAGHVGQALAMLCPFVGFRTVIIDDRSEFANRERFPEADDIRVQESLEDCFAGLNITEDSYVVIVTRGHACDRSALARSLRTGAGYIGMIGSKTKRDTIYKSLLEKGFSPEDINRVHSPIGLPIGAQTPAEIAVSILAELIAERSGKGSFQPPHIFSSPISKKT